MKLEEEQEILKLEKLKIKEQEKMGFIEEENQILEDKLTSRLETFDIKENKKN